MHKLAAVSVGGNQEIVMREGTAPLLMTADDGCMFMSNMPLQDGKTALDVARTYKHQIVVSILQKAGGKSFQAAAGAKPQGMPVVSAVPGPRAVWGPFN